jgi:hypothetical protein
MLILRGVYGANVLALHFDIPTLGFLLGHHDHSQYSCALFTFVANWGSRAIWGSFEDSEGSCLARGSFRLN